MISLVGHLQARAIDSIVIRLLPAIFGVWLFALLFGGCGAPSIQSHFIAVPSNVLADIAKTTSSSSDVPHALDHSRLVASGFVVLCPEFAIIIISANIPDPITDDSDQSLELVRSSQWQIGFKGQVCLTDRQGRVHRGRTFTVQGDSLGRTPLPNVSMSTDAVRLIEIIPSSEHSLKHVSWAVVCKFTVPGGLHELQGPLKVRVDQRAVNQVTHLAKIGPLRAEETIVFAFPASCRFADDMQYVVRVLRTSRPKK